MELDVFGLGVKLPVAEEMRLWADEGFVRLEQMLGRERMLEAEVVLPEDRFFPDRYDGTHESVVVMAERIAAYMGVPRDAFVVEIYAENEDAWRESLPVGSGQTNDAAGLYFHEKEEGRYLVGVHAKQLKDPLALVAVLAHELVHVILLGGELLDRECRDMEPMTDLATVYLGLGFFGASASFQFKQWTDTQTQGWSTQRAGYLPEELWGYCLARFAFERGEMKPRWEKELPTNVREAFAKSARWLAKHGGPIE